MVQPKHAIVILGTAFDGTNWYDNEYIKGIHFIEGLNLWEWDMNNIKIFAPESFPLPHITISRDAILDYLDNFETTCDQIAFYIFDYTPIAPPGHDNDPVIQINEPGGITFITKIELKNRLDKLQNLSNNLNVICNGLHSGWLAAISYKSGRLTIGSYNYFPQILGDYPNWDHFDMGAEMSNDNVDDFLTVFYFAKEKCIIKCRDLGIAPPQDPFLIPP